MARSLVRASSRQLAGLYKSLAQLYSAGLPLSLAARALQPDAFSGGARSVAGALTTALAEGRSLSEGAAAASAWLPPHHAAALAAGETSGRVVATLEQLAGACEADARLERQAQANLMRPLILMAAMAVLLPLPVLFARGAGAWLATAAPAVAFGVALLGIVSLQLSAARGSGSLDLPGIADLTRLAAAARWARTVALMSGAGLALPVTLTAATQAAGAPLRTAARRVELAMARGARLTDAVRQAGLLHGLPATFLGEGEATGRLDVALAKAADMLDEDVRRKLAWRVQVVTAAAFLISVAWVGYRVVTTFTEGYRDLPD